MVKLIRTEAIMKKCVFLYVLFVFIWAGCNSTSKPKEVLMKYLNNYYRGNYAESYILLSSKDRNYFKSQKEYELAVRDDLSTKFFTAGKITFQIKNIKVDGSNAQAIVEITKPDLTIIAADFISTSFALIFWGKNEKDLEKMIDEKFKNKSLPMTTIIKKYDLIKEEKGWRVFLNLEGQEKAKKSCEQAIQLEEENKFEEAKAKYQEALLLDKNNETAQKKIAEIDKKIEEYKIKKAYFDKIKVMNVHVGTSYLDEVGIFGEIKNNGDKTLNEIKIKIYCLDKNGKIVFEKICYPVLVTKYSIDDTSLKPNYSRKFGCKLDDVPSDWSKKVKVEITDVEFK